MELKTLYLNKIEENHLNLDEILSRDLVNKDNISELEKIKQSIKNIKESNEKNLNISDVVGEISNIGKSTKKLGKNLKLDNLSKTEEDIRKNLTLEESLDRVVRNFLDRNKLVLFDLDSYINIYLNLVYEQKIYSLSLKYRDILDEIRLRKEEDSKLSDGDIWELFFNSISVTSNVYGISFNGEVKNFSTRLSKNKGNTEFKLFGEKGNTIGEFKGFINFNTELTESTLNIPEADLKDLGNNLLKGGEGVLFQSLSTNGYHLSINGSIHLKNMKLDIDKVIESMKIEDEVIKEIIAPLLRQLNTGEIYYSYDTDTRILTIKTNVVEVFDDILNGENSSLKTKIRERIKSDFLKRIAG